MNYLAVLCELTGSSLLTGGQFLVNCLAVMNVYAVLCELSAS